MGTFHSKFEQLIHTKRLSGRGSPRILGRSQKTCLLGVDAHLGEGEVQEPVPSQDALLYGVGVFDALDELLPKFVVGHAPYLLTKTFAGSDRAKSFLLTLTRRVIPSPQISGSGSSATIFTHE